MKSKKSITYGFVLLFLCAKTTTLYAAVVLDSLITLGYPQNIQSIYGNLLYGAERPDSVASMTGLNFVVQCVEPVPNGFQVYGTRRSEEGLPQVWKATSTNGYAFHNLQLLYTVPDTEDQSPWKNSELVLHNDTLTLIQCRLGVPPTQGHPFYSYRGKTDGSGWQQLQQPPIYKGQDALCIVWNDSLEKMVNYQTAYQPFSKRFPDNMPSVRRVLHIRTSSDGVTWYPGNSFGVDGPHLPDSVLILPDSLDSPDTEFYKLSVFGLNEYWAGIMTKYVSQPSIIPNRAPWPHGPFLEYEWWISKDGMRWERPYRERSALNSVSHNLAYRLTQPFVIGNELRWIAERIVYSISRNRMFYVYSKANAEIITKTFQLSDTPLSIALSFESHTRREKPPLSQGYVMAELLDEEGNVIPGFEREKCVFEPSDSDTNNVTLQWGQNHLPNASNGSIVKLRLLFRDVKLYSLSY